MVAEARANELVAQAGADACADGLWVRFVDGTLGVVPLATWRDADTVPERAAYPLTTWSSDRDNYRTQDCYSLWQQRGCSVHPRP